MFVGNEEGCKVKGNRKGDGRRATLLGISVTELWIGHDEVSVVGDVVEPCVDGRQDADVPNSMRGENQRRPETVLRSRISSMQSHAKRVEKGES
jgi:hypothetical protein